MLRFAPSTLKSSLLVIIAASAFSSVSQAAPLNLNYTATYDGSSIINTVVNPVINTPDATSVSTYTNTYGPLLNTIPGSISTENPTGFEFYDDYVFTIGGSSLSAITATIDLNSTFDINNLNVRLFSLAGNAESNASPTVTIGSVASSTLLQAWYYATGTGDVAVIDNMTVAGGTYVLQVRGNSDGSAGGAYVGQLQVTPVPIPAALPLLLSGLGLLGVMGRKRKN